MPDLEMSGVINDLFEQRMADLSDQLTAGDITLGDWQIGMRDELRQVHKLQLVAAADGDKANVAANDWLKLGPALKSQYAYLEDFARDIQAGNVAGKGIANRARMYAGSGKATYWKQAMGTENLPAFPGDGSTPCLTKCGCRWVKNADGSFRWERGKGDSCDPCLWREENWQHYVTEEAIAA